MAACELAVTQWGIATKLIVFACCVVSAFGQCPKPPNLQTAQLKDADSYQNDSFSVGTVLTYECRPDYVPIQSMSVTSVRCLENGTWTTIEEFCERQCPKPPNLQTAQLKDVDGYQNDSFAVDTVLTYVCRPGYVRIPGMSVTSVRCLENGTWTPIEEFCQRRKCGTLPDVLNGGVSYSDDLFLGSVATFSCDEGYIMTGSPTRVCEVGGWSLQNPTCDAVICDDPPTIKGGECSSDSVPSLGVVATCRCFNKSEHLIGVDTIYCTALGNWSQPLPYCKEVHCSNPEVENGYKESNFGPSYTYKDSVSFKCKEGFKMYGDSSITCSENNTWVPPPPECKRDATPGTPSAVATTITIGTVTGRTETSTNSVMTKTTGDATPGTPSAVATTITIGTVTGRTETSTNSVMTKTTGNIPLVLVILTLNIWMHM